MAWKGVTLENIDTINPIDGSDFIDKATLKGSTFQFVVKKGQFNVGDEVLYAEIDTLLPQWVLQELGLEGKLSGKDRNRVKTVSLRKTLSQGLVMPVDILGKVDAKKTDDLNEVLGVEKYEAPVIPCKTGLLMPLPDGLSKYDIEGTERHQDILDIMRPLEVEVTEKLEGQNASITFAPNGSGEIFVNQRNNTIKEIEGAEHDIWKVARRDGWIDFVTKMAETYQNSTITVYGEMIGPGIQGNIYKLKQHEIRAFDIKVDNFWLGYHPRHLEMSTFFGDDYMRLHAPVLAHHVTLDSWLAGRDIDEASTGKSELGAKLREGIVIKPLFDRDVDGFGRLILKKRSMKYLAKTDN